MLTALTRFFSAKAHASVAAPAALDNADLFTLLAALPQSRLAGSTGNTSR